LDNVDIATRQFITFTKKKAGISNYRIHDLRHLGKSPPGSKTLHEDNRRLRMKALPCRRIRRRLRTKAYRRCFSLRCFQ